MSELERIHPDDIEAIAQRTAELVRRNARPSHGDGVLTARQVAERLGVKVGWVYENADALGGLRLGGGSKPRLRFDPARSELLCAAIGDGGRTAATNLRVQRPRRASNGLTAAGNPLLPDPGAGDV